MNAWIFTLLLALSPPAKVAALPAYPGWAETAEQREARYHAIADSIAHAARTPSDAAVLVALAFMESGFAPDVDAGRCYRGKAGTSSRCDSGQAYSLWQIHAWGEVTAEKLRDRDTAAMVALGMVRRSRAACRGADAALDVFAGGRCSKDGGAVRKVGKARLDLARRLLREHPYKAP